MSKCSHPRQKKTEAGPWVCVDCGRAVDGAAGRLAEMFAEQRAPQCVTDSTYMRGHCNGNQFEKQQKVGNRYRTVAERLGQNTKGKRYLSGLAAFQGDPEAWVSGRGDVQRVLEKRGWGTNEEEGDSTVKVKAREPINPPESPHPEVADDIVDGIAARALAKLSPADRARADLRDLREQIRDKVRPPKHLRKPRKKR